VPKSWTGDPQRCAAAGIPEGLELATKPQLAQQTLQRALDADVPFAWVTAQWGSAVSSPLSRAVCTSVQVLTT
jgi:SRSO17 transposase